MIAPARMNSGIASSGKLVAPLYVTTREVGQDVQAVARHHRDHRDDAERHGDRHVDHTSASTAANSSSMIIMALRSAPLQAVGTGARLPAPGCAGACGTQQRRPDACSSATTISARRDRNHRLHDAHRHSRHADQRVAAQDRHDRRADPAEQREERDDERSAATILNARRAAGGIASTQLGAADVRALDRRQRRAVEREPGEQHRRDLVVPDQRLADRRGTRRRASPRPPATTISADTTHSSTRP